MARTAREDQERALRGRRAVDRNERHLGLCDDARSRRRRSSGSGRGDREKRDSRCQGDRHTSGCRRAHPCRMPESTAGLAGFVFSVMFLTLSLNCAGVAELADAPGLGPGGLRPLEVQVLSPALWHRCRTSEPLGRFQSSCWDRPASTATRSGSAAMASGASAATGLRAIASHTSAIASNRAAVRPAVACVAAISRISPT
jgi:hypothetical protein